MGEMVKDLSLILSDCSVKLNHTRAQRAQDSHTGTCTDRKKKNANKYFPQSRFFLRNL